jgi:hypothetical protein
LNGYTDFYFLEGGFFSRLTSETPDTILPTHMYIEVPGWTKACPFLSEFPDRTTKERGCLYSDGSKKNNEMGPRKTTKWLRQTAPFFRSTALLHFCALLEKIVVALVVVGFRTPALVLETFTGTRAWRLQLQQQAAFGPGAPLRCRGPCASRRDQERQQRQQERRQGLQARHDKHAQKEQPRRGWSEEGGAQARRDPLLSAGGGRPALAVALIELDLARPSAIGAQLNADRQHAAARPKFVVYHHGTIRSDDFFC